VARVGKNNVHVITGSTQNNVNFSNREVFYTNDFSNASDWVTSAEAGNDNWVIGSAIPSGAYLIDPIESTTAANGFQPSKCVGTALRDSSAAATCATNA
jgi:hypothetical protein